MPEKEYTRKPIKARFNGTVYECSDGTGKKWTMPKRDFEALYDPVKSTQEKLEEKTDQDQTGPSVDNEDRKGGKFNGRR